MRILVITPAYPHSGNEIEGLFNEQHALVMRELGVDITIVLCKPWIPGWLAGKVSRYKNLKGLPRRDERNGIEILYARYLHIPQYRFIRSTVSSCARAILKTLRCYGRTTFDLIQVHSVWPVGLAAPVVSRILRIPFVLTAHIEDDFELYTSMVGHRLYDEMLEQAAKIVAVGSPLEKFICKIMSSFPSGKLMKIPNGIDMSLIDSISEQHAHHQNDIVSIVSVCNLWHVKGIDLNLRALAGLHRKGIHSWNYTVVGNGPERHALEQLARDLEILEKVHFIGRLLHKEALRKILKADIFSMPSRSESFGLVFLEAMACGKPVIGCFGTGAEDLILNNKTGILVPKEDIESLSTALERLMANMSWAKELGEAGRRRAGEFTWENSAVKYIELYHSIINSEKRVQSFPR